ncbi:MAG TPA: ATP-binding protein [Candidatus Competibacter sp.]|nr:ATP-binding protein [Candidatus Competibacter sp.]
MTAENSVAPNAGLRLPAELDRLPAFLDYVRRMAEAAGLSEAQGSRLELAVEEALVNVFGYAYAGRAQAGAVLCRCVVRPDGLRVEIVDEGVPFDPLACADPDTALDLDERQPGGLGILLVRRLADEIAYRRDGEQNVLMIEMHRSAP